MISTNDVFVFSDVTGTDAANFNLRGGTYITTIVLGGGTVALNVLAADQTTWVPFQTWSSNAAATFTLVAGLYQFAWDVGATESTFGIAQQPPSPTWRPEALSQPLPINVNSGATNYQTLTGFDSITLETPDASGDTGTITISTGDSGGGDSGGITIHVGNADGTRGTLMLNAALISAPSGFDLDAGADPISLTVSSNNADNGAGSDVTLQAGPGGDVSGNGGNINLNVGTTTGGNQGLIIISHLPTSASGLPTGALWNSSGTLKVA